MNTIRRAARGVVAANGMPILLSLLALAGCGPDAPDAPAEPAAERATAGPATAEPSEAPSAPDPERLISAEGIGRARLGMTLGDLRAAAAPDVTVGQPEPYMVDWDGVPVVRGADTLYHVLVPYDTPPDDSLPLELLATQHPSMRTAEGVGPGVTLARAAEVYGSPTLSYSWSDEGREYARFPRHPAEGIHFRVEPASDTVAFAGVYASDGEYNETTTWDPNGRVMLVLVELGSGG